MKKYVITGGPCYGKTTLVNELGKLGFYPVEEAARMIIEEELKRDGKLLPWIDRKCFQKKVIEVQLELESKIPANTIAFLDRGLPDALAYYELDGVEPPKEMAEVLKKNVYAGVFLLEELENYETDSVRKEDRKTARRIQELLEKVYTRLGYSIIRVPALPPRERAEFVKKCLEQLND